MRHNVQLVVVRSKVVVKEFEDVAAMLTEARADTVKLTPGTPYVLNHCYEICYK